MRGKGEQLKMFMTPREITAQYQPLDGDRMERADLNPTTRGGWDAGNSTDQNTNRPRNTQGESNFPLNTARHGKAYAYNPGAETSPQLWGRKLEESKMGKLDYNHAAGGSSYARQQEPQFDEDAPYDRSDFPQRPNGMNTDDHIDAVDSFMDKRYDSHQAKVDEYHNNDESLHDSVRAEGVKSPIHLGQQFGMEGKPQIVGGHHRTAAAMDTRPDDFVPVLHHTDIYDARKMDENSKGGYKYS